MCVACVVAPLVESGCGHHDKNRGAIGGEVKLDGMPIVNGSISFMPLQGTPGDPASGKIAEGRYRISANAGPAIGWNRVEIRALHKTGRMVPLPFPSQDKMIEETVQVISPRFNSQSSLKFEVKPGDNRADFKVTSK
jgi:hypothetical protein